MNNLNSVIHDAYTQADLTKFLYTKIYSSVSTTITLNGTSVPLTPGVVLDIRVKDISVSTSGVFLIGSPLTVFDPTI
jgi:hypothetical protein